MNCCASCFNSKQLIRIVESHSKKGQCQFCHSKDVHLMPAKELIIFFRNLFDQYIEDDVNGDLLDKQILEDFPGQIFSNKSKNIKNLLEEIISTEKSTFQRVIDNKVLLENKKENLTQVSKIWSNFKNEIKFTNRFHIQNHLDLEKLKNLFTKEESLTKHIKPDSVFFRGRFSTKEGLSIDKMSAPPPDKATSGRANPKGIAYLYLANDHKTVMYELRSALYDYLTIGHFKSTKYVKILNLNDEVIYDPMLWTESEEILDFLNYNPFIRQFQEDLSKPIRRNDKEIDYLPTQYICEFIKSIGFDGVEFQSSLNSEGYNLAIFQIEKFECIKAEVFEITNIDLSHKSIV